MLVDTVLSVLILTMFLINLLEFLDVAIGARVLKWAVKRSGLLSVTLRHILHLPERVGECEEGISTASYHPLAATGKGPGRRGLLKIIVPPKTPSVLHEQQVQERVREQRIERKGLWERSIGDAAYIALPSQTPGEFEALLFPANSITEYPSSRHQQDSTSRPCTRYSRPNQLEPADRARLLDNPHKKSKGAGKLGLLKVSICPPTPDLGQEWLDYWTRKKGKRDEKPQIMTEPATEYARPLNDHEIEQLIRKTDELLNEAERAWSAEDGKNIATHAVIPHSHTPADTLVDKDETDVWLEMYSELEKGKLVA